MRWSSPSCNGSRTVRSCAERAHARSARGTERMASHRTNPVGSPLVRLLDRDHRKPPLTATGNAAGQGYGTPPPAAPGRRPRARRASRGCPYRLIGVISSVRITVAGVDVVEVELVRIERGGGHPLRVTKTSNRASATSFKYAAAQLTAVLEPRRSARRGALVDDRELGKLLVIEVGVRRSSSSVQARRVVDSRARVA
jgi:hypothetical protein